MAENDAPQERVGPQGLAALPLSYCSLFNLAVAPNDFHLTCGTTRAVVPPGQADPTGSVAQWTHTLVMSPHSAKQLAQLLAEAINQYEKQMGVINSQPLPGSTGSATAKPAGQTTRKR